MNTLDYLLLKEALAEKVAQAQEAGLLQRIWQWLKARPERARELVRGRPLTAAGLAALLGGGLGAGATYYGLRRKKSSFDDFVDDYDLDYLDDIIDELEKEAALEELAELFGYWY